MVFLKLLSMVFLAEMGDKTQLFLVALAARYPLRRIIPGVLLAILLLNLLAVGAGALLGGLLPLACIKLLAALAFLGFALSSLAGALRGATPPETPRRGTVFVSFFLAECGDKTQLCVMTFAAGAAWRELLLIWAAGSLGLFLADLLGLLTGCLLRRRLPEQALGFLSAAVFAVFGLLTMTDAARLLFPESGGAFLLPAVSGAALLVIAAVLLQKSRRPTEKMENSHFPPCAGGTEPL